MDNISEKIQSALELVWATQEEREAAEGAGVKIVPNNFYSNVPSINDIKNSFEYSDDTLPPYGECDIYGSVNETRDLLHELRCYAEEYNPDIEDNEDEPEGFFWKNSQFSYSVAMSYYALIRHIKPKNIIEIDSGFSTLVAIDAIAKNEVGEITCVEPFPRKFLEKSNEIKLLKTPAQEITPEWINDNLENNDVLFIDSTHTVKTGSDCMHIYLRLLPKIKRDIYVHVHDVFLPFGVPEKWLLDQHIYWTEQHLLLAFLLDNNKTSFIFGSSYHYWANKTLLDEFMHGKFSSGGSSFWFKYNGSKSGL